MVTNGVLNTLVSLADNTGVLVPIEKVDPSTGSEFGSSDDELHVASNGVRKRLYGDPDDEEVFHQLDKKKKKSKKSKKSKKRARTKE